MLRWLFRAGAVETSGAAPMPARVALSTAGVLVQGLVRFLYTVLIARFSSPTVLGVVGSSISLALLLTLLWPTSAAAAVTKFLARERGAGRPESARGVVHHLARRTIASALPLAAGAGVLAFLLLSADVATSLATALLVLAYSGYSFVRGVQFATGRVPLATAWEALSSVLAIGLLVAVLLVDLAPALLLPLVAGYAAYTVAGWPRGRPEHLPPQPLRREMDGFIALGVVGTLASTGFLQLSMVVARVSDPGPSAGYYSAALALATPASMLARSLSMVLFPAMAEAHGRSDSTAVRRQADLATRALFVVMPAVFGGLLLCAELVVDVVYGPRYAPAARLLQILLVAVLLPTLAVAAVNALTSARRQGIALTAATSVTGLVVGALLWLWLEPRYGVTGVAAGYLLGSAVVGAGPFVVAWRADRHRWAALVLRLLAGLGLLVLLESWQRRAGVSGWSQLLTAAVFVLAWWALSHRDARRLLASLRPGAWR